MRDQLDETLGDLLPERDELAEVFGGRTPEEKAELEREKEEVQALERAAAAKAAPRTGKRSKKVLHWISGKVRR